MKRLLLISFILLLISSCSNVQEENMCAPNIMINKALLTYIWVKSCIKLQDFLLLWAFY